MGEQPVSLLPRAQRGGVPGGGERRLGVVDRHCVPPGPQVVDLGLPCLGGDPVGVGKCAVDQRVLLHRFPHLRGNLGGVDDLAMRLQPDLGRHRPVVADQPADHSASGATCRQPPASLDPHDEPSVDLTVADAAKDAGDQCLL